MGVAWLGRPLTHPEALIQAAKELEAEADARDVRLGGPSDRSRWDRDLAARLRAAAE